MVFRKPEQKHHRAATVKDLFFDLIFVAALSAVGSLFQQGSTDVIAATYQFLSFLSPFFFTWHNLTMYHNRFYEPTGESVCCSIGLTS